MKSDSNIPTCTSWVCSHFSLLDGFGDVDEYAKRAGEINQQYLCVTDHGAMGSIPSQIRACEEHGIHPVFGCELYINPLQPEVNDGETTTQYIKEMGEDDKKRMRKSNHLLALAYTNEGYSNLVHLSSWGWVHGFYYKPRINREVLKANKEGLIFTSCCYNSEIAQAYDRGGDDEGFDMVQLYIDMLGTESFYLAIMLLDFHKQRPYNGFIQRACRRFGLKATLEQDCHVCNKEDIKWQRIMLMIQTNRTMAEIEAVLAKAEQDGTAADIFELQDSNLWMKSEEDINQMYDEKFRDTIDEDFFEEAKRNTVRICERCKGVTLDRSPKLPRLPDANDKLKQAMIEGHQRRALPNTQVYKDRIREEYDLICHKDFASYFLIQKMQTDEARRWWGEQTGTDGTDAVGPGRGCLAGDSLVVVEGSIAKRLDEVRVGDRVMCLSSRFRSVTATHQYAVRPDEKMVRIICAGGDPNGVVMTLDHKVFHTTLIAPKEIGSGTWVKAKDLKAGDWVFTACPEYLSNSDEVHAFPASRRLLEDGGEWRRVLVVGRCDGLTNVYDLTVEDEHDYHTTSFLVHNSGPGALTNYLLGICDVNPIDHDLLFSRFLSPARGGKSIKTKFSMPPLE